MPPLLKVEPRFNEYGIASEVVSNAYRRVIILKSPCESRKYCILMLFLDDSWSGGEYSVGNLTLA